MVGDKDQKNPGIIPRSFSAIFDIIQENNTKFDFKVTGSFWIYMDLALTGDME